MQRAARVLGYGDPVILNLCAVATPSLVEVNTLGRESWLSARADLQDVVLEGGDLLAAWGVGGLTGIARQNMGAQIDWLVDLMRGSRHREFWTVGGEPRHPSRWHQYVADVHNRTHGGNFEERLAQVLVQVPVEKFKSRQ